mmetsp:Transcript_7288/g.13069  ORF Transcript_7288/g.13069 Transcript_7288/m.13069 type:complete len:142 (+) Transcript_7288:4996-5421(+)
MFPQENHFKGVLCKHSQGGANRAIPCQPCVVFAHERRVAGHNMLFLAPLRPTCSAAATHACLIMFCAFWSLGMMRLLLTCHPRRSCDRRQATESESNVLLDRGMIWAQIEFSFRVSHVANASWLGWTVHLFPSQQDKPGIW